MSATAETVGGSNTPHILDSSTLSRTNLNAEYYRIYPNTIAEAQPNQAAPNTSERSSPTGRAKRLMATFSVFVNIATSVTTPSHSAEKVHLVAWEAPPLPSFGANTCAPTPESTITTANQILTNSDAIFMELYVKYNDEAGKLGLKDAAASKYAQSHAAKELNSVVASRLGLKIFSLHADRLDEDLSGIIPANPPRNTPYSGRLEPTYYEPGSLPIDTYLDQARAFLSQYGVSIEIGDPKGEYAWNLRGTTTSELDTWKVKQSIYNLMFFFSNLPKELIDLTGLKHIVLTATKPGLGPKDVVAVASADFALHSINLNMDFDISTNELGHELTHLVDAATCGANATATDPQYTSLNAGVNYDPGRLSDATHQVAPELAALSLEDAQRKISNWYAQVSAAANSGDQATLRRLAIEATELKRQLVFASIYGETTVNEDKAEVEKGLFKGNPLFLSDILNASNSRLEAKFVILFARLYYYSPAVATFLAAVNKPYYTGSSNAYLFPNNGWIIKGVPEQGLAVG